MSQVQPPSKDNPRPSSTPRPADPRRVAGPPRPTVQPPRGPVSPPVEVGFFDPSQRTPLMLLVGLIGLLVAAYWDMFTLTSAAWSEDLYSHGWIIPLFAAGLLWLRWQPFGPVPTHERWLGLLILGLGLATRLFAAEYTILPIDRLSFIPSIFGAFMLVGGMHAVRWAWPALVFLVFMFPLPTALEVSVLNRLHAWPPYPARSFCRLLASPRSALVT